MPSVVVEPSGAVTSARSVGVGVGAASSTGTDPPAPPPKRLPTSSRLTCQPRPRTNDAPIPTAFTRRASSTDRATRSPSQLLTSAAGRIGPTAAALSSSDREHSVRMKLSLTRAGRWVRRMVAARVSATASTHGTTRNGARPCADRDRFTWATTARS